MLSAIGAVSEKSAFQAYTQEPQRRKCAVSNCLCEFILVIDICFYKSWSISKTALVKSIYILVHQRDFEPFFCTSLFKYLFLYLPLQLLLLSINNKSVQNINAFNVMLINSHTRSIKHEFLLPHLYIPFNKGRDSVGAEFWRALYMYKREQDKLIKEVLKKHDFLCISKLNTKHPNVLGLPFIHSALCR